MLKSIHKAGVIHGDIRLSNLCVNDAGEAFIIDFSHAEKSSSRATMDYMDLRICVPIWISKNMTTKGKKVVVEGGPTVEFRRSTRIREAAEKAANDKRGISKESRRRK